MKFTKKQIQNRDVFKNNSNKARVILPKLDVIKLMTETGTEIENAEELKKVQFITAIIEGDRLKQDQYNENFEYVSNKTKPIQVVEIQLPKIDEKDKEEPYRKITLKNVPFAVLEDAINSIKPITFNIPTFSIKKTYKNQEGKDRTVIQIPSKRGEMSLAQFVINPKNLLTVEDCPKLKDGEYAGQDAYKRLVCSADCVFTVSKNNKVEKEDGSIEWVQEFSKKMPISEIRDIFLTQTEKEKVSQIEENEINISMEDLEGIDSIDIDAQELPF